LRSNTVTQAAHIPRVDLAETRCGDPERTRAFDAALRASLEDFGFVRVAGHGIAAERIEAAYRAFEAFFALPDAVKREVESGPGGQRGFTPFGIEHAKDRAAPDHKEFFHIGRELPEGHPLSRIYPANLWPEQPGALRHHGLALYEALDRCAAELLASLERAFELPSGTLSTMLHEGNSILRALHYPPTPPGLRAAAHEDINLITLLCEASDPGLEIQSRDGAWLPVPALPGEIVVDAGDMLARVTNERLPSTTHRVVTREGSEARHRYALPFFAHPTPASDLRVLPQFVPHGEAPRHPPITAGDFLEQRLREIGLLD